MTKRPIDDFHIEYETNRMWERTSWLGVPILKLPFDLWIMQELIFKIKPDYVIETGTAYGGSTLFYSSILRLLGHGKVITVDTEDKCGLKSDLILKIIGSSIDYAIFKEIREITRDKKNIVFLDSWHSKDHVLKELGLYSMLIPVGSYIVAEDTHVSGHPVKWKWGEGPYEAVQEFLKHNSDFEIDKECEKLIFTFNPSGYLRRIK